MDLKLVCHSTFLAIFIWAQTSSAVETYDELYIGCFIDDGNNRVLPDAILISDNMTIQLCIDYCTRLTDIDSAYAGVEFGNECYCGVAGTNYSRLGVAGDSKCNWSCAGDNTAICGSNSRISIYNIFLIRPPTTPAASTPFERDESTISISTHSAKSEAATSSSMSTYTGSTTNYNMSTGSSLGNTVGSGSSLVPTLIYTLVPLFVIAIFGLIVCLLCRRKWLKHGSSQGIAASGEPRESPGIKDNPTFESSNVQHVRKSDIVDCHGGNDQYIALTTPHDARSVQVYQTLSKVVSQGDGYEVPVNGANGQTGPEYGKTLHKLQEHPDTDYEIAHEYQDITNNIVKSPTRGLQVQPETDYEAIHEYEDPEIFRSMRVT